MRTLSLIKLVKAIQEMKGKTRETWGSMEHVTDREAVQYNHLEIKSRNTKTTELHQDLNPEIPMRTCPREESALTSGVHSCRLYPPGEKTPGD